MNCLMTAIGQHVFSSVGRIHLPIEPRKIEVLSFPLWFQGANEVLDDSFGQALIDRYGILLIWNVGHVSASAELACVPQFPPDLVLVYQDVCVGIIL